MVYELKDDGETAGTQLYILNSGEAGKRAP